MSLLNGIAGFCRRQHGLGFLILLFLGAAIVPLPARLVPVYSYDQLWKEADVVAVLEPVRNENNGDRFGISGWPDDPFQGVTTYFKVRGVFKGGPLPDEIVLKHFVDKTPAQRLANGPELIRFTPGPITFTETISKEGAPGHEQAFYDYFPVYLAFLKKAADGTFLPLTGQIDPVFSFRELRGASLDLYEN